MAWTLKWQICAAFGDKYNQMWYTLRYVDLLPAVHRGILMIWPFGKRANDPRESLEGAVALIDASNLYAAGRHLHKLHDDPNWSYKAQYKRFNDECLFVELMHFLILYDRIIIDGGSIRREELQENMDELAMVVRSINKVAGFEHIVVDSVAPRRELSPVVDAVCRMIAKSMSDIHFKQHVSDIHVPWYYRDHGHFDYPQFLEGFDLYEIDKNYLPFALFLYRGVVYSGYSNHYNKTKSVPMAYIASAGRLQALQPIIDKRSMDLFEFPRAEYLDLVELLGLPGSGYDFSHFSLGAQHISSLQQVISHRSPMGALEQVYELRGEAAARTVRDKWVDRLWGLSESCAIGARNSNWISGSTIHGNVTMIHASARD